MDNSSHDCRRRSVTVKYKSLIQTWSTTISSWSTVFYTKSSYKFGDGWTHLWRAGWYIIIPWALDSPFDRKKVFSRVLVVRGLLQNWCEKWYDGWAGHYLADLARGAAVPRYLSISHLPIHQTPISSFETSLPPITWFCITAFIRRCQLPLIISTARFRPCQWHHGQANFSTTQDTRFDSALARKKP